MHSAFNLALFALLVVSALAVPTPIKSLQKRTFSIKVKPRTTISISGHSELVRALRRHHHHGCPAAANISMSAVPPAAASALPAVNPPPAANAPPAASSPPAANAPPAASSPPAAASALPAVNPPSAANASPAASSPTAANAPPAASSPTAAASALPAVNPPPVANAPPAASSPPAANAPPAASSPPAANAPPAASSPPAANAPPAASSPPAASAPPAASPSPAASASPATNPPPAASASPASQSTVPAVPKASGSPLGQVAAVPEALQALYLSPVTIGGQSLNLDFDTGSADLWVFSTSLPANEIGQHRTFDPTKSSTFSLIAGASFAISYGDTSFARGTVGTDTVSIGGATVPKQAVELANTVSTSFVSDVPDDGILGLGFSTINTVQPQKQKTFFENIMPQLAQAVFTADLQTTAAGTYEFGAIDTTKFTGPVHYTPVNSAQGFWQFSSPTFSVGGVSTPCTTCSPAIADTGTSLLLMDDNVVSAYYAKVAGAQRSTVGGMISWTYPCASKPPDFGVAIGTGFTAVIPGSALSFAQVDATTCFGGVQSNNGIRIQIFGDFLLKHYFAVFDGGNMAFGLATKP